MSRRPWSRCAPASSCSSSSSACERRRRIRGAGTTNARATFASAMTYLAGYACPSPAPAPYCTQPRRRMRQLDLFGGAAVPRCSWCAEVLPEEQLEILDILSPHYCSRACEELGEHHAPRFCGACDAQLVGRDPRVDYCDRSCRDRAYRMRAEDHKAQPAAPHPEPPELELEAPAASELRGALERLERPPARRKGAA